MRLLDTKRKRDGKRVRKQSEKRKQGRIEVRVGILNVATMTGKGRELVCLMEKRRVDILCVQEAKWKGSKARNIGSGFKFFNCSADGKRNGVGVILKEVC